MASRVLRNRCWKDRQPGEGWPAVQRKCSGEMRSGNANRGKCKRRFQKLGKLGHGRVRGRERDRGRRKGRRRGGGWAQAWVCTPSSCRVGRAQGPPWWVFTAWRLVVYTSGTSCAHRGLWCSSPLLLGTLMVHWGRTGLSCWLPLHPGLDQPGSALPGFQGRGLSPPPSQGSSGLP